MESQLSNDGTRSARGLPYMIEPSSEHTYSIILFHGLGSNGTKFGTELLQTGVRSDGTDLTRLFLGARLVFPTAKRRRSSAFRGAQISQWCDVASLGNPSYRQHTQIPGLEESYPEIRALIIEEVGKVSAKNVLLGGLSRGFAMSVTCLLSLESPIGGFIGMSGYMPYREDIHDLATGGGEEKSDDDLFGEDDDPFSAPTADEKEDQDPIVKSAIATPIFIGHGDADAKVSITLAESARDTLSAIGFKVRLEVYEGLGHCIRCLTKLMMLTSSEALSAELRLVYTSPKPNTTTDSRVFLTAEHDGQDYKSDHGEGDLRSSGRGRMGNRSGRYTEAAAALMVAGWQRSSTATGFSRGKSPEKSK